MTFTDEKTIEVEMDIDIVYEPATPEGLGLDSWTRSDIAACARYDAEWVKRVNEKYPGALRLARGGNSIGPGYVTFAPSDNENREVFQACEDISAELAEHPEIWR
jgi:hypothetical protein